MRQVYTYAANKHALNFTELARLNDTMREIRHTHKVNLYSEHCDQTDEYGYWKNNIQKQLRADGQAAQEKGCLMLQILVTYYVNNVIVFIYGSLVLPGLLIHAKQGKEPIAIAKVDLKTRF